LADIAVLNTTSDLSGKTLVTAENAYTISGVYTFSAVPIFSSAIVLGAASTSGIRLEVNSGIVDVREGDDSAAATLRALTLLTTGAGVSAINDDANAKMTTGLTINQGAADDEILSLKSSDVDHGMTDIAETDTYGYAVKASAASGGLYIVGLSESTSGMIAEGIVTSVNTAKTTGAVGAVLLDGSLKSGTSKGALSADANIAVIRNNGTTRFIFDAEGSAHADVEWTTFDTHDDLALLDTLDRTMHERDAVTNAFGEALKYNADSLTRAGIVNFYDPESPRAMVNFTRLSMLHTGALRQIGRELSMVRRALAAHRLLPEAV
jgi:hypothetical protein